MFLLQDEKCDPFLPFLVTATKITETKCVGDTLSLSCDKGKRLFLSTAQYGYDDLIPQTCSSPSDLRDNKNIGKVKGQINIITKGKLPGIRIDLIILQVMYRPYFFHCSLHDNWGRNELLCKCSPLTPTGGEGEWG